MPATQEIHSARKHSFDNRIDVPGTGQHQLAGGEGGCRFVERMSTVAGTAHKPNELAPRRAGPERLRMVIAVASGKGDTGKTMVAAGLAVVWKRPVLAVDLDVEEPIWAWNFIHSDGAPGVDCLKISSLGQASLALMASA